MSKFVFIVAILLFVFGGAYYWQEQTNNQIDNADNSENLFYITANGEVFLAYPKDWQATDLTIASSDEGLYSLELESPGSDVAAAAVRERFDFDLRNIVEDSTDEDFVKVLNSPQADRYALLEVNSASANNFELFESLDEWFEEFVGELSTTSGVSVSQPEPFEVEQGEAIQFYTSIVQGDETVRTWHVFALGVAAQVESILYPADNSQFQAAQDIMSSLVITEILLDS